MCVSAHCTVTPLIRLFTRTDLTQNSPAGMDGAIVLDSDKDDSDVEIIESSSFVLTEAQLPPLTAVKVHVDEESVRLAKVR